MEMPSSDLANGVHEFVAWNPASRRDQAIKPLPAGRSERAIWFIIGGSLTGLLLGCYLLDFRIALGSELLIVAANAILLGAARALRERGRSRVAGWLTATAQMSFATILLTALSYVLASTNFPLCDTSLIALDRAMGIDWQGLIEFMMNQRALMLALNVAYVSLHYQCPFLLALLFLLGRHEGAMRFALAWLIALAGTVVIFPFTPALGGYVHYQLDPRDFPEVRVVAAWLFSPPFYALRDGSLTVLELAKLDGIVTFPSFHAAAALLMGWRWMAVPLLRWPMLFLNILMLLSSVPVGGHYIVDVIAGSLLAILSIVAARAWSSTPSEEQNLHDGRSVHLIGDNISAAAESMEILQCH